MEDECVCLFCPTLVVNKWRRLAYGFCPTLVGSEGGMPSLCLYKELWCVCYNCTNQYTIVLYLILV
ncbi:hypothetical protein ACS0TY_016634 [Phlomoides rotata]